MLTHFDQLYNASFILPTFCASSLLQSLEAIYMSITQNAKGLAMTYVNEDFQLLSFYSKTLRITKSTALQTVGKYGSSEDEREEIRGWFE